MRATTQRLAPWAVLAGGLLLAPAVAWAGAGSTSASVVDVPLDSGLVGHWTGVTRNVAFSFLPFLLVVALIVEAFGRAPGAPKDFGAAVWRFVVVGVLLAFYAQLFGRLAGLIGGVAERVAPLETWDKLGAATDAFLKDKAAFQAREMSAAHDSGSGVVGQWLAGQADALGGALVDAAVSLILLCGQAAFRVVGTFGQVLSMLLYVLGPLAIVASVPRGVNAGVAWLRTFVSVLLWPLISALLVGLLTGFALEALRPQSSYEAAYKSIALAGILAVTAFAVPVIASALSAAGLGAIGAGWSSVNAWAGAASGAVGAVGSAGGAAARATAWGGAHGAAEAARASGAGGAPPGTGALGGVPSAGAGGRS